MSSSVASQGCFMLHLSVTISHEQSGAVGCFGNNSCYCNTPTCLKPSDVTLSATKLVRGCSPGHVLHTRLASPPTPQSPTLLFSPNKGEYTNLLQEERRRKRWGVWKQAAISSRLHRLQPCSLTLPPLSHAPQQKGVLWKQRPEGQGSIQRGCLKSFGMLMLCRVSDHWV